MEKVHREALLAKDEETDARINKAVVRVHGFLL